MKTIQSVLRSMARSPLKSVLTLATVGLGVGVLIFALSISSAFSDLMEEQLQSDGIVLNIANAEIDQSGAINEVRPPEFDENVIDAIRTEVSGVVAISPISSPFWSEIVANGTTYRVRSVAATNDEYIEVMGLELIAGSFYTAGDVATGAKSAVVTESLAEILFGSAGNALGNTVRPPTSTDPQQGNQLGGARAAAFTYAPTFTIVGVVEDAAELQRKSYQVADMMVPYTSVIPQSANAAQFQRFMMGSNVVKIAGIGVETAEAQIRDVLTRSYGDDVRVAVWEGGPAGESEYLAEIRQTVSTFTIVVNLLGFILLAAASIGILSIMLVEALGRSREIALERAIGASKKDVFREFFARAVIVSLMSATLGIGLSLVLAGPLKSLIMPIFAGVSLSDVSGNVISASAVLIGSVSALLIGGLFGVFPVFSVLRGGISETLREA